MKRVQFSNKHHRNYDTFFFLGVPVHTQIPQEWISQVAAPLVTPTSSQREFLSLPGCPTSQTSTLGRPWRSSTCSASTESCAMWFWWWEPRRFMHTVWFCRPAAPTSEPCSRGNWPRADRRKSWSGISMNEPWSCSSTLLIPRRYAVLLMYAQY